MFPLPEEISLPFDTAPNSLRFSILFSPLESLSYVYRDFNSSSSIILIAFPPGEVLTEFSVHRPYFICSPSRLISFASLTIFFL